MKKTKVLIPFVIIGVIFWGCTEETPLGIEQHTLDMPNSPPAIAESNLTDGDDFSVGYYNGNIRSDMVNLEWEASEDENFLAYKIFRATGGYSTDIFEGFESGSLPSGWTEYGDNGGWYVTSGDSMNYPYSGDYFIQSNFGYYGYEYLEKTISVPQYSDIFISYYSKGINDGDGYFFINGYEYDHWGYDYDGSYWNYNSEYYNTGSNTEIVLAWVYSTENYGYGLLDNIEISGVEGGELSYSLIETLNDKNTSAFWDDTLTHNQYYTYKVATIVEQGTHTVDDIEIKTPLWQAPGNVTYEILSPEVVEVTWEDNSESETSFKVYVDEYNYWDFETISNQTSDQDNTSIVITDLDLNILYRLGVKAYNAWEQTDTTYSSSFEINFDPPSNLNANQQGGSKLVDLYWNDNSSLEDGFEIERDMGTGFELLTTVGSNTTSYTDTDTTNFEYDSTYTYRIRAYNDYSGTVYTNYSNDASVMISETSCDFDETSTQYWYSSGASTNHYFYPDVSSNCSGTLIVTIDGDYDSNNEYADIYVDGNYIGTINPTQNWDTTQEFSISQSYFNDGNVIVTVENSYQVNTGYGNDLHRVQLIIGN